MKWEVWIIRDGHAPEVIPAVGYNAARQECKNQLFKLRAEGVRVVMVGEPV